MLHTEEKQIGDHTFKISQLGSREGRRILVRLIKLLGPALGEIVESRGNIEQAIGAGLSDLARNITNDDLTDLCQTFGNSTEVIIEGKPVRLSIDFQEIFFAGRYGAMMKWLKACLEVNFADFTELLGATELSLRAALGRKA